MDQAVAAQRTDYVVGMHLNEDYGVNLANPQVSCCRLPLPWQRNSRGVGRRRRLFCSWSLSMLDRRRTPMEDTRWNAATTVTLPSAHPFYSPAVLQTNCQDHDIRQQEYITSCDKIACHFVNAFVWCAGGGR